jgi:type IV secretory pathway VirB10-like protein
MSDDNELDALPEEEQASGGSLEEDSSSGQYEDSPEALTSLKPVPGLTLFNRKKVIVVLCIALSCIVLLGVIFASGKSKSKNQNQNDYAFAARAPSDFLQRERDRSLLQQSLASAEEAPAEDFLFTEEEEELLPEAVQVDLREPPPAQQIAYPQNEQYSGGVPPPQFVAHFSPLVPVVAGSLLGSSSSQPAASSPSVRPPEPYPPYASSPYASQSPQTPSQDQYAIQNNQDNKTSFYNSGSAGVLSGSFLPADILWIGTIIPAVLETAINTDLPGNVIARVTQNIYDSLTGKKLLVPQGTLLIAKYNSSVSYAQSRVQIVWDLLIRPDGYQIELEGMNGVDVKGMAGLRATYHENWFEYVKAAGIITMFSVANGKMAEEAAKYGSADTAAAVVAQGGQFMNQIGGNIIGRAMNIQPTLTIASGEKINVMLNKNIYLPPMEHIPVTQKYILQ